MKRDFRGQEVRRIVILLHARWCCTYKLSLPDLENVMMERDISMDHGTLRRWSARQSPKWLERFDRRKRSIIRKRHIDET